MRESPSADCLLPKRFFSWASLSRSLVTLVEFSAKLFKRASKIELAASICCSNKSLLLEIALMMLFRSLISLDLNTDLPTTGLAIFWRRFAMIGLRPSKLSSVLGKILEYRKKYSLRQISYCYIAEVVGKKGRPNLMDDEIEEGFQTVWMPLKDALENVRRSKTDGVYEAQYMVARDTDFLETVISG